MTRRQEVLDAVERAGIVAVIRIKEPERLKAVVDAISEGGVRVLEVTMTVPNAPIWQRGCRQDSCSAPEPS
jgi:2-dehydro-3-deoxyphosphogluconate aldolase/(4S)-4-hydroxy-2-oxoglutarate aldolase